MQLIITTNSPHIEFIEDCDDYSLHFDEGLRSYILTVFILSDLEGEEVPRIVAQYVSQFISVRVDFTDGERPYGMDNLGMSEEPE